VTEEAAATVEVAAAVEIAEVVEAVSINTPSLVIKFSNYQIVL
jgi:hypothetical protein